MIERNKIYKTISFEVEKKDGSYEPYEADIEVDICEDENYGADADGRGGVYRKYIYDFQVMHIRNAAGEEAKREIAMLDAIEDKIEELDEKVGGIEADYEPI